MPKATRRLAALIVPAALSALVASSAIAHKGTVQQQRRPNVVVVMSDDQTVESMRVLANVQALLAREGTTFANNVVSYSLCCPSRSTFLTGQYAHNHGVMGNAAPNGGYYKLDSSNTLPLWLQRGGYHTVHIGKYLNGYGTRNKTEVPPGWSEWYGGVDPTTYRYYGYTLNENGKTVSYGQPYQADVYTAKAVDAVRRLAPRAEPFFLSVAYLAPHAGAPRESDDPPGMATPVPAPRHRNRFASEPLPRPASFNEADVSDKPGVIRNRRLLTPRQVAAITENYRQRLESILAIDEGVAQIVAALRAAGELDETLFIYTSDNGFFHGEHRIPAGKVQVYEPSIRVPLIIRGPGVPRGRTFVEPSINVDLAPTIVDAANVRVGRVMDGRSLLPLLAHPSRRWGRDALLETPGYTGIRTPRYKYVEYSNGERELYDLARDPDELQSLHANPSYAAVRTELARRLIDLRTCRGAGCRAGPRLALATRCSGKRHRARLSGPDVRWTREVDFSVNGHVVSRDGRRPFTARVSGRRGVVRARATLADGRVVTLDRAVRACG
jgi:N-acetylglucosamine-6-sulfatase